MPGRRKAVRPKGRGKKVKDNARFNAPFGVKNSDGEKGRVGVCPKPVKRKNP